MFNCLYGLSRQHLHEVEQFLLVLSQNGVELMQHKSGSPSEQTT